MKSRTHRDECGRVYPLLAVVLGGILCGISTASAAPGDEVVVLSATLLTEGEVPPLAPDNPEINAHGTANVVLKIPAREGEEAEATLMFFVCGLPGSSITFVKVDVHKGASHTRGSIAIDSRVQRSAPLTLQLDAGCATTTLTGVAGPGLDLTTVAREILANPADFYFELHTLTNQKGMVRGELVR